MTANAAAAVPAMAAVKQVHHWAQREQDEGQCTHHVCAVLGQEEESGDREKAEEDPGERRAALRASAEWRRWMEVAVRHDLPFRVW
jgi:hypothetical protein